MTHLRKFVSSVPEYRRTSRGNFKHKLEDILALGKRVTEYETMGDLFRAEKEQMLALTLWNRVLDCIRKVLEYLSQTLGITPEQMIQGLLDNENAVKELAVILNALQKNRIDNEKLAG